MADPTSPVSERAPLLDPAEPSPELLTSVARSKKLLLLRLLVLKFLCLFAWFHLIAPKFKLLELTICRRFYAQHNSSLIMPQEDWPWYYIEETKCKRTEVQSQLIRYSAPAALALWAYLEST
jgi:hypothetical protein